MPAVLKAVREGRGLSGRLVQVAVACRRGRGPRRAGARLVPSTVACRRGNLNLGIAPFERALSASRPYGLMSGR